MGPLRAALAVVAAAAAAAAPVGECLDSTALRYWNATVAAGATGTTVLGTGQGLEIRCLWGEVTSSAGAPEWVGALVATDSTGAREEWPATGMYNGSRPYRPRVFNAADPNTTWAFEVRSYNWIWSIDVNARFDVRVSPAPLPTPPPPQPLAYRDAAARVAAVYAAVAYNPPGTIQAWRLNASCAAVTPSVAEQKLYHPVGKGIYTPFAYTAVDHPREWIVVGFKGTNDTYDMILDVIQAFSGALYYHSRCDLNQYIGGRAHAGMCQTYLNVQAAGLVDDVIALMAAYPDYAVMGTGHSLGGALVTLFAADLTTTLRARHPAWVTRVGAFTFGAPRVADYGLGANLPPAFRVTHADDAIPHLGPCCAAPDGRHCMKAETCPYHVDAELWYPKGMHPGAPYRECGAPRGEGEDPRCSNSLPSTMSIEAHLEYFGMRLGTHCYPPAEYEKVRHVYEADAARYHSRRFSNGTDAAR
eukprot:TRINITY_DN5014_c1_g1_i1.p1 TRINITY_DN5014_c1_g1~~TRINITY_DN5014_c1_g1_i1.p1  ORF type:complete len:473 (+),score=121.26 TRINITY_DN5014_c1_g1_i1:1331-2749(+)